MVLFNLLKNIPMKKITLLLITILLTTSVSFGQQIIFEEAFMGSAFPATWTNLDVDALPGDTFFTNQQSGTFFQPTEWTRANFGGAFGAAAYSLAEFKHDITFPDTANDWVISPQIGLLVNPSLSFQLNSIASGMTAELMIATTLAGATPVPSDFTSIQTLALTGDQTWTDYTQDLSAYANQSVYLAIRHTSVDQALGNQLKILGLRNFKVTEAIASDVVIDSVNLLSGVFHPSHIGTFDYYVVDYSKRTAVTPIVSVKNIGTNALDTVIVTAAILDAMNNGIIITDTVPMSTPLAVGASYVHTFAVQDLTSAFPSLGTSDYLNFVALSDSSHYNQGFNTATDRVSRLIIAPIVSYNMPFSTSFEVANVSTINFDHSTWGWKYFDNDGDGNTLAPYTFSNITMHDGSYGIYGSIINGNSLSVGAVDETLQSPEFTLTNGTTYQFSIYARTWPSVTGTATMHLTNAAGALNTTIGTISAAAGDTTNFVKHSFSYTATATSADFMININKGANSGFIILDQFEIVELFPPTAPVVSNSWNPCDSTLTTNISIEAGNTYSIDWGDGTTETITDSVVTHQYTTGATSYTMVATASNLLGSASTTNTINTPIAVSSTFTHTACGSYTWIDGNTYTATTDTPTHTIPNGSVYGCDSVVTLDLTIKTIPYSINHIVNCGDYTYTNGDIYTSSTTIIDSVINGGVNGCDSFIVVILTILDVDTGIENVTACGPYTWIDGNTYTSTTTAMHTIVDGAANNCDSTVILNFALGAYASGTDVVNLCAPSYTWIDGNTYTSNNNTATHTIPNGSINGCDSIVTLNLNIKQPGMRTDTVSTCNHYYVWPVTGNAYYYSTDTVTRTIVGGASNGCDSIITLDLTLIPPSTGVDSIVACNSYVWIDHSTYTSSNNTSTHTIEDGAVSGCDSIVTLNLSIEKMMLLTIAENNGVLSVNVSNANYQWIDCNTNSPISGATNQSFEPQSFGQYAVVVTSTSGICSATSDCFDFSVGINNVYRNDMNIYPNPTKDIVMVELYEHNATALVDIKNSLGQTVISKTINKGINTIELKDLASGLYFIHIELENKKQFIEKLIKQ